MAVPAFGAVGTASDNGNNTTCNVPVPAGVAADHVILVPLYVEQGQAVTPPTGFEEARDSPVVVTGSHPHYLHMYWKRATGADTGNYAFTIAAGLDWRVGVALRFTGVVKNGYPFDVTTSAIKTSTTDGNTPAVSQFTNGPDRLWVWAASLYINSAACTPPTGFTERAEVQALITIDVATMDQAVQGGSGSLVGTFAVNGGTGAWLGALLPEPASNGRMSLAM